MKTYSVGVFTHSNGVYGVEASELGLEPGKVPQEIGITHRSGVVSRFKFTEFGYNKYGNVDQFNYAAADGGLSKLAVFND